MRLKTKLKSISRRLRAPVNRKWAMRRLREYHSQNRDIDETVFWALNFGGSGFYRVKSLQIPDEITALAKTVASIRPAVILEIGTAAAGTLLIWSKIASSKVVTCDLQDMTLQSEFFKQFPPPGSSCKVIPLSGDSHSRKFQQQVSKALEGDDVDFLFIDGDHSEEGVWKDFLDYRHLVRPGGLIAFHDIVESQPLETNEVYRLWKKLRNDYVTEEYIADPEQCGYGIGVVRVQERFPQVNGGSLDSGDAPNSG